MIERIPLRGDETALDAGCGTGRVTRLLAERLPRGRVIAVDGSRAMVEEATERLADLAPRVSVRHGNLLELELDEPVDLIVSTATFHWILDHDALFRRLFAALRPGGRLVAQCGGRGQHRRHPRRGRGRRRAGALLGGARPHARRVAVRRARGDRRPPGGAPASRTPGPS